MASKLTKLVIFAAAAGAAAAGVYYYMQKKEAASKANGSVDEPDVFEGDLDSEGKRRFYVNLNLDNVESALSKAKEKIADSYQYVKDSVKAGLEGATGGSREFVDLTETEDDSSNDDSESSDIIKDAEEKLTDAANEGVTKVENFFDEEE
jgi:DNA-directed RNA polymerase subunit L